MAQNIEKVIHNLHFDRLFLDRIDNVDRATLKENEKKNEKKKENELRNIFKRFFLCFEDFKIINWAYILRTVLGFPLLRRVLTKLNTQ